MHKMLLAIRYHTDEIVISKYSKFAVRRVNICAYRQAAGNHETLLQQDTVEIGCGRTGCCMLGKTNNTTANCIM